MSEPSFFDWFFGLFGGASKIEKLEGHVGGTMDEEEPFCTLCHEEGELEISTERDPKQIIQSREHQYISQNNILTEKLFPVCENNHIAHYSCIRDWTVKKILERPQLQQGEEENTGITCAYCRRNINIDLFKTITNGIIYNEMLVTKKDRNRRIENFETSVNNRNINYDINSHSFLYPSEICWINYDASVMREKYNNYEISYLDYAIKLYSEYFNNEIRKNQKNGYKNYIKIKKQINNMPIAYKGKFYKNSHADVASLNILKGKIINNNELSAYFRNVKKNKYSQEKMSFIIEYFYITYLIYYVYFKTLKGNSINALQNFINGNSVNMKLVEWVYLLDPRVYLFNDFQVSQYVIEAYKFEINVPIPLYNITTDHAIWLYSKGFCFTRFAKYMKKGKSIDDYNVSIPKLLFSIESMYDNTPEAIADMIVHGSGIDYNVALAIGIISHNNRDDDLFAGSVRFENGPYNGMDMSYKHLQLKLIKQESDTIRRQLYYDQLQVQNNQERDGLRISELLFPGETPSNYPTDESTIKKINEAIAAQDLEKFNKFKIESFIRELNFGSINERYLHLNGILKKIEKNSIFYHVMLFHIGMINIIFGEDEITSYDGYKAIYSDYINIFTNYDIEKITEIFKNLSFDKYINSIPVLLPDDSRKYYLTFGITRISVVNDMITRLKNTFNALKKYHELLVDQNNFTLYRNFVLEEVKSNISTVRNEIGDNRSIDFKEGYIHHNALINSLKNHSNYNIAYFNLCILEFIFSNSDDSMTRLVNYVKNGENDEKIKEAFNILNKDEIEFKNKTLSMLTIYLFYAENINKYRYDKEKTKKFLNKLKTIKKMLNDKK